MDIIGFDQQIGFAKKIVKAVAKQTAARPTVTKPSALRKMVTKPTTAARPMATKPGALRKMVTKPTTAARPMVTKPTTAIRPMVTKPTTAVRPMVTKPAARKFATKFATKKTAPAQVPYKMTAKTTTALKPTSAAANNAPLAVVKPNGTSIPLTTLTQTTNPAIVESVNPIQRSFMPIDLPYQQPNKPAKKVRLKNTNLSYKVSVDLIQPPVDAGLQDYYGK